MNRRWLEIALDAGLGQRGRSLQDVERTMAEKLQGGGWERHQLWRHKRAVELARQGCTPAQIAAKVDRYTEAGALVVVDVLKERGELAQWTEEAAAPPSSTDHLRKLARAASDLRGLIADGHVGPQPPESSEWEPHLDDAVLEECLLEHLQGDRAGQALDKHKREGRKLSRQARGLMDKLRRTYSEAADPGAEGLILDFCESVYLQAIMIVRGGQGLTAEYERVGEGEMWYARQGAFGLAQAATEVALESLISQHKEAISLLSQDPEVKKLLVQEGRVTVAAGEARRELGLLAHGRPMPGRCQACPEVR